MSSKLLVTLLVGVINTSLLWSWPSQQQPRLHLDEPIGTADTAGYTYCGNSAIGRTIAVDSSGWVSLAWTNCVGPFGPQYIYSNLWNPLTGSLLYPLGVRVDAAQRAGCVTQATLGDLFCYAFHQLVGDHVSPIVVIDFVGVSPAPCYEGGIPLEILWPRIGANGYVHLISTEYPESNGRDTWMRLFYSRGLPVFDEQGFITDLQWDVMSCGGFEMWDSVMVVASDVACSRHSDRCAVAWLHSMDNLSANPTPYNNEIYLRTSEDAGLNWSEPINVTHWTPWDQECYYSGGDPRECDRDTFRCYTDVSLLFDENDFVHIAFTTTGFWWYLPGESDSGFVEPTKSMIYHWSEQTGYYSLVADGWSETGEPESIQRNVQSPSLAVDTRTGFLYCSYQKHDTSIYAEGLRVGDAFVSVSTDNGINWAMGTNVTNTQPDSNHAMDESEICLAPTATNGILHMQYLLNQGSEEPVTPNPVIYQRIPVDSIATAPLMPRYPMHYDSAGYPQAAAPALASNSPVQFELYQNYPNPFNAATTLRFHLYRQTTVTLKVYNVLGQEVTKLIDNKVLPAGTHQVQFDGSKYSSGIYICRLQTPGLSVTRKMLLLK